MADGPKTNNEYRRLIPKVKTGYAPLRGREDEVVAMCKSGHTDRQIAEVMRVNWYQVMRFRQMRGIKSRYDNSPKMPKKLVRQLWERGKTYAEIAKRVGKTAQQVKDFCYNHFCRGES